MSVHDINTFFCSNCGKAIPDRDKENQMKKTVILSILAIILLIPAALAIFSG